MALDNYSRVQLTTDDYQGYGVSAGSIGYIIEVYGDEAYEVEFSDQDGITVAQLVVKQEEVKLAEIASSDNQFP